jgi:hypothetical protein
MLEKSRQERTKADLETWSIAPGYWTRSRHGREEEITASRSGDSAERRTLKANYSAALFRNAATVKIQSRSGQPDRRLFIWRHFVKTELAKRPAIAILFALLTNLWQ